MKYLPLLLLLAGPAFAQDTRVQVTNTSVAAWNIDNGDSQADNDDYGVGFNRLVLQGTAGDIDTLLRVDALGILGAPTGKYESDAQLERLWVRYRLGDWRLEGGDHHVELGRGIVLSLRPIEAAGVDIALRGGRVEYVGRPHQLSVFAGLTNSVNFDVVSNKHVDDKADFIAGLRYAVRPAGWPEFAVFGAHLRPEEDLGKKGGVGGVLDEVPEDHTTNVGASIDLPAVTDWLSIYLEGDFQRRLLLGEARQGMGGYVTVDLSLGETQVLLEGLYLNDWFVTGSDNDALERPFEYNRPPTLERIDQEVFNNQDLMGGRLRLERSLGSPDVVGHVNGLFRLEHPGESNEERLWHGYGGIELYVPNRITLSGGYRDKRATGSGAAVAPTDPDTIGSLEPAGDKTMIHGELDYAQPLGESYELHLVVNAEYRTLDEHAYTRGTALLSLDRAGLGGLTAELGYDDQNENIRNLFAAGIVHWRISEHFDLRATGGTQRGGIKCVGGVCREFPAFAGGKAELVVRY